MDFISKLAALIPTPGINLTRFHGVFAPNSKLRASIVNCHDDNKPSEQVVLSEVEKRRAMNWAMRLKRAFNIDISTCEICGGTVKVMACIDDPVVINKILVHLQSNQSNQVKLPYNRAPPSSLLHTEIYRKLQRINKPKSG